MKFRRTNAILLQTLFLFLTSNSFIPQLYFKKTNFKERSIFNVQLTKKNVEEIEVQTEKIRLSSGITAEVMTAVPNCEGNARKAPLIFIHGSFHAAWCWAEHYLPYFAALGYYSTALSLRGTSGTYAGNGIKKVKIGQHVSDLDAFIQYVVTQTQTSEEDYLSPILVAHSFGGLAVMKYLEQCRNISNAISGVVMLCSVPPSGNGKMTLRYLRRSLRDSWMITSGFVLKSCMTDAKLCRSLFFGGNDEEDNKGITDEDLARFQSNFAKDTEAIIDLGDLSSKLPSKSIIDGGRAFFWKELPPVLVVGASNDFIVDDVGVKETAAFFGVEPVEVDSPHDIMLGRNWKNGADAIHKFITESTSLS